MTESSADKVKTNKRQYLVAGISGSITGVIIIFLLPFLYFDPFIKTGYIPTDMMGIYDGFWAIVCCFPPLGIIAGFLGGLIGKTLLAKFGLFLGSSLKTAVAGIIGVVFVILLIYAVLSSRNIASIVGGRPLGMVFPVHELIEDYYLTQTSLVPLEKSSYEIVKVAEARFPIRYAGGSWESTVWCVKVEPALPSINKGDTSINHWIAERMGYGWRIEPSDEETFEWIGCEN